MPWYDEAPGHRTWLILSGGCLATALSSLPGCRAWDAASPARSGQPGARMGAVTKVDREDSGGAGQ